MNQQFRFGHFNVLPPVVKNLLIINGLFFLGSAVAHDRFGIDIFHVLGMHYWTSEYFKPYQLFTHLFIHLDLGHIFSNMFMLWMFGSVIENVWGSKRFLIYYFVTGLGAAIIFNLTKAIDLHLIQSNFTPEQLALYKEQGFNIMNNNPLLTPGFIEGLTRMFGIINGPSGGASGAVYGVLLAFGMLFPNTYIYLYFLMPIKAKYVVIGFIVMELLMGIANNPGDNIAHFAHLGGMIFGYIMIRYWNKNNRKSFY